MKAFFYTTLALIAFAANSLLCRMALAEGYIDAWNLTAIRLLSAAVCLAIILLVRAKQIASSSVQTKKDTGGWLSSISLVIYALCFSIAYIELNTGTGALILFSGVQLTMISWSIANKERLSSIQWAAFVVALAGFVYLMLPSAAVPSLLPALLMSASGIAWGVYSIRGKACEAPLSATSYNFFRSLLVLPLLLIIGFASITELTWQGVLLACASGALASGVGYSIWYVALPLLKSSQAAIVQLCVPVLAAFAGVLFLNEQLTPRFIIASGVILGAVLVFLIAKQPKDLN